MKVVYIVALLLLILVVVLVVRMSKKQELFKNTTVSRMIDSPATRLKDDSYINLITQPVPRVGGVSFPDNNAMLFYSMMNGGMMTPGVLDKIAPKRENPQAAYTSQVGDIENSLELEKTQELQRYHLASANANYIPPNGVPTNTGLWYQRNYLQNLDQPGLKVK